MLASCLNTGPAPVPPQDTATQDPDIAAIIQNNDLGAIEELFKGKELINKPSKDGLYPLHLAVVNNSEQMVKLLLSMGAKPDPADPAGKTPLRYAIDLNTFNLAKILIANGARLFTKDSASQTPFDIILAKNAVDRVLDSRTLDQTDELGRYPLHVAVERFSYSGVVSLLQMGAAVNQRDSQGRTPLDIAFLYPHSPSAAQIASELVRANGTSGFETFSYFVRAVRDTNFSRVRFPGGMTVLHEAVRNNHIGFLQFFLDNNVPVDLKNDNGLSPLLVAVQAGNVEAIKLLIAYKADINMKDAEGTPPLSLIMPPAKAATVIDLLLSAGSDPFLKDKAGNTALQNAVINNYPTEVLGAIIQKGGKSLLDSTNSNGDTALSLAVSLKRYDAIQALAQAGANPFIENKAGFSSLETAFRDGKNTTERLVSAYPMDTRDAQGNSMLHHAVQSKAQGEIIKYLIARQGSASPKNNEGDTPLHIACQQNLAEQGEILILAEADLFSANARGQTPVMLALGSESGSILPWFFTPNTIKARDTSLNTPLHYSARAGSREGCIFLVNRGADMNAVNRDGRTPLMTAIQSNSLTAVNALLALGASVNVRDTSGFSPLHLSVQSGALPITQLLVKMKSIQIDVRDFNGKTPLCVAVELNDTRSAELLLASGANPVAGDAQGKTSLHLSVKLQDTKILSLLLEKTSFIEVRDDNGTTPLLEAMYRENAAAADVLVKAGASIHARDGSGESPLSYALKRGQPLLGAVMNRNTINSPDADGRSVLHVILEAKPSLVYVQEALELGAFVNARDSRGKTALHLASENNYADIIRLLVSRGADIFLKDSKGASPLLFALGTKSQQLQGSLLMALLSQNPNLEDILGDTALHYAASLGNEQAVLIILSLNPDKQIVNANGETARDVAVRRGYARIAELLK